MFADASEGMMCALAFLGLQPKEYPADLAFVIGNYSGIDETSFNTTIGIASGSHDSEVERTHSQGSRKEDK